MCCCWLTNVWAMLAVSGASWLSRWGSFHLPWILLFLWSWMKDKQRWRRWIQGSMTKEWNGTQWSRKIHFRGGPASNTCLLQILKHWKTRKKTHHSPVPLTGNCRLVICNCRTVTPAPDTGLCPYCRADLWLLVTGRWLERPALTHGTLATVCRSAALSVRARPRPDECCWSVGPAPRTFHRSQLCAPQDHPSISVWG